DLWKYFHAKIKNNKTASVNASFYDIREFFQGRNAKGIMKTKSEDVTYNALLANLREKLGNLTENIQPKVYKYGFLK
ncbi:MAG: nucleoside 5-triphosphatase RdgB (dHAPTP, dITP,XTP-specific), partial [Elusimicrobiota bacterium]|nr:nucleoside 5-triphosphatase RdgB (dHAPTP, dITP,XTP-specific) [Elusimicrobiota bacterium]MDR3111679.1 nucleoside 5-triphosphatase RdgB (dHAPTP, dITP,XTP-specific) [Elusimicrobiota bacterium]